MKHIRPIFEDKETKPLDLTDQDGSRRLIWQKEGKIHREGGPASIKYYPDGTLEYTVWYKNGDVHRDDGPAWIDYYHGKVVMEIWYQHGIRHRDDGPARIKYKSNGSIEYTSWAIDGVTIYDPEEVLKLEARAAAKQELRSAGLTDDEIDLIIKLGAV